MHLTFHDANVILGRPMLRPSWPFAPTADDLLPAMRSAGVDKALVYHAAQIDASPIDANPLLDAAIAQAPELSACWTLLPPDIDPLIGDDFFANMRRANVRALRAFPDDHRYLMRRPTFGSFLDDVSARRIPLFLSLERGIRWQAIYDLMTDYPDLTCVLCDLGSWSSNRYLYPVLRSWPRVYVETSMLALADGAVEAVAAAVGPQRLLFGSGYPKRYIEAPMLQLIHAALPATDKAAIASENLDHLLAEANLS